MSFKYIDPQNVGYIASDADTASDIAFGAVSPGETYIELIKLGNTGSADATFTMTGLSVNGAMLSGFYLSKDGTDYEIAASGIVMGPISPNAITDMLYVKLVVPDNAYIGDGTIRLYVTE